MDNTYSKTEIDTKLELAEATTKSYFQKLIAEFEKTELKFEKMELRFEKTASKVDMLANLLYGTLIALVVGLYLALGSGQVKIGH